ncbi:MAG: aconitate hydratase [bacterium]
MKGTVTGKILSRHLVEGHLVPGNEVGIRIAQTLSQDATGTMAWLQFEALGIPRVKTELSVSYVDHNMLQTGFENMDDHLFLQSAAAKFGAYFSRPGNGICHQVHLERFARPGRTLLGSDSHTPTSGGMGMIAMGAGGLDVAVAMGGGLFYLVAPRVCEVRLTGSLRPWVSAKDVILEVLRRLGVKGGLGMALEYTGPGIESLYVPDRATITNMGAETGATTSVFPSDRMTRDYLERQGRESDFEELLPDSDAEYEERLEIDLSEVEPMVALPGSPGNAVPVREAGDINIRQVLIGSCTNSSYRDLMVAAAVLKDRTVHPEVSLSIMPGSRQVLTMMARSGALADLVRAGARVLESSCAGCIGMGSSPATGINSVRTFNRNFPGRSGTRDDRVFLTSPETAAVAAVTGRLLDPTLLGDYPEVSWPETFLADDRMILPPADDPAEVELRRGPNIKPIPASEAMPADIETVVLLKVGDDITTDHIMPAGAKVLPLRSNLPAISEYVFESVDPSFPTRARERGGGMIVGGENYGQGSSREHAAMAPMALGIRAVAAKSFARIHKANLVNFGILPLVFENPADYDKLSQDDEVEIPEARQKVMAGGPLELVIKRSDERIKLGLPVSEREARILAAGGLLNYIREQGQE